jgi:hypothetical protein
MEVSGQLHVPAALPPVQYFSQLRIFSWICAIVCLSQNGETNLIPVTILNESHLCLLQFATEAVLPTCQVVLFFVHL